MICIIFVCGATKLEIFFSLSIAPSEFIAYTPTHKQLRDSPQLHHIDSLAQSDNVAVETARHIQYLSPPLHTHQHDRYSCRPSLSTHDEQSLWRQFSSAVGAGNAG